MSEIGEKAATETAFGQGFTGRDGKHYTPPNETSIRTNSNFYNKETTSTHLPHEILNSAYNHHVLVEALNSGRARDIADEPKANGTPCIVTGSGPSLDDSIKLMHDWKGGVFCSTSQARTLMYYGVEPTHICILDPFCPWRELEGVDWSKTKTKLVTHPGAWHDLIERWPNEILLYRQDVGRVDSFFVKEQPIMYSKKKELNALFFVGDRLIKTELMVFANSPPLQLYAAIALGYGTAFLAGCDFAYHEDKGRFTEWIPKDVATDRIGTGAPSLYTDGAWFPKVTPTAPETKPVTMANGLLSSEMHRYYKVNMLTAWRLSAHPCYTTDHGAITEMPYVEMEKVVRKQGKLPRWPKEKIERVADRYLASIGGFVIETSQRKHPVESIAPEHDIPGFIGMILSHYKCDTCELITQSQDNLLGKECPRCKAHNQTGHFKHAAEVDVAANLRRIFNLVIGTKEKPAEWKVYVVQVRSGFYDSTGKRHEQIQAEFSIARNIGEVKQAIEARHGKQAIAIDNIEVVNWKRFAEQVK